MPKPPTDAAYQLVDSGIYPAGVTTQIAIRLEDDELAALDREVAEGRATNRSHAVRRMIARLQRDQRYRRDDAILLELARRGEPLYPDLEGMLDSIQHPPLD